MGQKAGKESRLKRKEVREFMSLTHFNSDEVRCLYEHFRHISSGVHDDGVIDKEEFTAAMGFQNKFYVDRMFQLFDENGDGAINFTEFLCGLSILSTKARFFVGGKRGADSLLVLVRFWLLILVLHA